MFVQLIEFTTSRWDEVEPLVTDWREKTEGRRTAHRATITKDRDRPDTYIQLVESPSYEAAMANSNLPEMPHSPSHWPTVRWSDVIPES